MLLYMKTITFILALLTLLLNPRVVLSKRILSKDIPKQIIVVGDKSYAPFEFLDAAGKSSGIFVDIWKLWSKKTGVKVNYKVMEWEKALSMVKEGKADAIGGMFYSKERAKFFDFSIPYLRMDTRIFFYKKIFGLKTLEDAAGFEVGVVKGDYADDYIKNHYPNIRVKRYPSYEDMVKDAVENHIKVFVCDTPVALFLLSKYKQGQKFKYSSEPVYTSYFCAAVKKGNAGLLKTINEGFDKISQRDIQNIVNRWTGISLYSKWAKSIRYAIYALMILFGLLLLLGIWSYILRRKIKEATKYIVEKNKEIERIYNRLSTIIETAELGYVERDLKGYVIDVNEQYLKLIGRRKEEVIGKRLDEWTYLEDIPLQEVARKKLLRNGYIKGFEIRYIKPDNTIIHIMANIARLKKEPERAVFLCQDITDKKRQEERIRKLARELEVTIESIGDGLISTDRKGKISLFNKVAEEITGWKVEEAAGRNLEEVFYILSEKTGERIEDPYQRIMRTKRVFGLGNHTLLVRKNGEKIPILDSGAPILGENGEILGIVIVFRDGREQRKREKELIEIERLQAMSKFSAGIAHDFNNLLAIIVTNLSLLKKKLPLGERQRDILNNIERSALEARQLTNHLILLGKGFSSERKSISYRDRLKEITKLILSGTNITVKFNIDGDLKNIYGDMVQIDQVIQNLLINAKQAMDKGGTVIIGAQNKIITSHSSLSPGEYVCFSVKDTGKGIEESEISNIFKPYFSTKKGGTGLGLFVVDNIIKNHDGYIELESKVGVGTEFKIYLPVAEKETEKLREEDLLQRLEGLEVLFMDDEEMFRDMIKELLPYIGARVTVVSNGEDAIEAYAKAMQQGKSYPLVILDLTIVGGEDGIEVGKKLLQMDKKASIVISTGHIAHPVFKEYKKYGFKAVIRKPYTLEELHKVIRDVSQEDRGY